MPIKSPLQAALVAAAVLAALPARAQTDDVSPFYAGGSVGITHVSNVYRQSSAANSDRVLSTGLLGGVDQRFGRQQVKVDGTLQHNRYADNSALNNQSHSLRAALNWQTVGRLSGTVSASSNRSLADFNTGNGIVQIFRKNTERNDEYGATARLGVLTRYTLEGGLSHRRRDFSAPEYDRFSYSQDTGSLGLYAMPGGNVKLGLVARHTKGKFPRYPFGDVRLKNDYTRDNLDFTTNWTTGGSTSLNTRISRSRTKNELDWLRDFSGTTGAVGFNWQATGKLRLNLQYARDTGLESQTRAADVNRVYTSWQLGGNYVLTSKVSVSANANQNRSSRSADPGMPLFDAYEANKFYNVGVRWAISRGFSLGCQYDRANRDSSVAQYTYSANSYGCTVQGVVY